MTTGNGPILYRDPKYGFTLKFPRYWGTYCAVSRKKDIADAEYAVQFNFKYQGKVYGPALTVLVLRMNRKEWVDQGYEDSPLRFIAEHDGRVFAYDTPEELPYAFINKKTGDYDYAKFRKPIQLMKAMVNRDVPLIIDSIRFPGKTATLKSEPYMPKAVRKYRC